MMNDFIKALKNGTAQVKKIIATFENGNEATYTTNVFWLLVSDSSTVSITDADTGEALYIKGVKI